MFDAQGANIPFRYIASFVDNKGKESAPSPVPPAGIELSQTPSECVALGFPDSLFDIGERDFKRLKYLRIYRLGGNSSDYVHLKDIDIRPVVQNELPYKNDISGVDIAIPETGKEYGVFSSSALDAFDWLEEYMGSRVVVTKGSDSTFSMEVRPWFISKVDTSNNGVLDTAKLAVQRYEIAGTNVFADESNQTLTFSIQDFGFRDKAQNPDVSSYYPQ